MVQSVPSRTVLMANIVRGKEALEKHAIAEAFDSLFVPSLFDSHAMRLMYKLVNHYHRMRRITAEQIKRNEVEDYAQQGYPMAQYVLGRYHQNCKPDTDSIEKAKQWLEAASKAGISDAAASQAVMVVDGYYGPVDMDLYRKIMSFGLEKAYTSDYCSFSLFSMLRELVFGHFDTMPDPQKAIEMIKDIIGPEESDDIDVVDPAYYKILGEAYLELDDDQKARDYFAKAVDMGYVECCSNMALIMPPDESFTHAAWEHWEEINMIGCRCGDPRSFLLASICFETPYDKLPDNEKQERTSQIKETLMKAYSLGDETAATTMGYNYYYGDNGFEQDNDEAWIWFTRAALWEDCRGFAMAAEMIENGDAPKPYGQEEADYWYLQALRRGDDDQIDKVVEIYRMGGLTDFAEEIETLYEPKYEGPWDEPEDDDGRWDAWA